MTQDTEHKGPRWTLGDFRLSGKKLVEGVEVDVPFYEGVKARIAGFRQRAWLDWLRQHGDVVRKQRGWDDDDLERAFYGERILLDLSPLFDEDGEPIEWTPETGRDAFLESEVVVDPVTGDEVKVYKLDPLFGWVKAMANGDRLFADDIAKN